jgi:LuxR family maltose regulon positive regulatory protein
VSVDRDEQDEQRFWLSLIKELRAAVGAEAFVERLAPKPEFEGAAVVERLRSELQSLEEPVVLVIDDLHELGSPEALAQLEVLLAGRPSLLRVVLATRRDLQLGLHRLRLAGLLTEIRASDLRFTLEETRRLLADSGVELSDERVSVLHARTEGWAAGLRLAALSLAGHPEPERFVEEFSGSEHTVADYLLAEVLERQPDEVRRLLLRSNEDGGPRPRSACPRCRRRSGESIAARLRRPRCATSHL